MSTVTCPSCDGRKTSMGFVDGYRDGRRFGEYRAMACHVCNGLGSITEQYAARIAIAERIRRKRVDADLTGDDLAKLLGMDRVALSHAEHGRPDNDADWATLLDWAGEA